MGGKANGLQLACCLFVGSEVMALDTDFWASTASTVLNQKTGRYFNSLFLLTAVYIPES